jgi:hypothetical protein
MLAMVVGLVGLGVFVFAPIAHWRRQTEASFADSWFTWREWRILFLVALPIAGMIYWAELIRTNIQKRVLAAR